MGPCQPVDCVRVCQSPFGQERRESLTAKLAAHLNRGKNVSMPSHSAQLSSTPLVPKHRRPAHRLPRPPCLLHCWLTLFSLCVASLLVTLIHLQSHAAMMNTLDADEAVVEWLAPRTTSTKTVASGTAYGEWRVPYNTTDLPATNFDDWLTKDDLIRLLYETPYAREQAARAEGGGSARGGSGDRGWDDGRNDLKDDGVIFFSSAYNGSESTREALMRSRQQSAQGKTKRRTQKAKKRETLLMVLAYVKREGREETMTSRHICLPACVWLGGVSGRVMSRDGRHRWMSGSGVGSRVSSQGYCTRRGHTGTSHRDSKYVRQTQSVGGAPTWMFLPPCLSVCLSVCPCLCSRILMRAMPFTPHPLSSNTSTPTRGSDDWSNDTSPTCSTPLTRSTTGGKTTSAGRWWCGSMAASIWTWVSRLTSHTEREREGGTDVVHTHVGTHAMCPLH